jgi:diadenosine tetraphosphatase ApaH/serine/threonine PP2A family protein phosphatase
MGNADDFLLEIPEDSPEPITERMLEIREWTRACLSPEDLAFIGSFQPVVDAVVEPETRLLVFHGSPRSFDDVLLPWSKPEAAEPFAGVDADLLAGGHTHLQWTRRVGDALFVNPGSVGLAYDHHQPEEDFRLTPIAEFAIVTGGGRNPGVEFRRLPYSRDRLLEAIRGSGRPHAESFAADWR